MTTILMILLIGVISLTGSYSIKVIIKYIQERYDRVVEFNWKFHSLFIFLLLLLVYFKVGFSLSLIIPFLMVIIMYCLSWYDNKTFWIPNIFNIMILLVGIPIIIKNIGSEIIISFSILSVIFILITLFYNKGLGGGDMKLYLIGALLFGYEIFVIFFLSMIISVLFYIGYYLIKKEKKKKIAFGPYICLSMLIVWLSDGMLLEMYLNLIGVV